ncbi:MAG: NUDIX domain-containing protein [Candidatus Daviesbacteria bacterium]|nr:NUDIX domain-containing protein [Candidatus Daviesbacteria bacterium]
MDEQIIIVCDEKGNPTGEYIPKIEGITGDGIKHLAISMLLYNNKGQVLLQKRKHKVFDNLWDLTASTDVSHLEDQQAAFSKGKDETFEQSTDRCLKREYYIGLDQVEEVKKLGGFSYFAKDGAHCENEYDMLLIGEYNQEIKMNLEVGYEYKWVDKHKFLEDIEKNPQNYTPWAIEGVKVLKENKFFD